MKKSCAWSLTVREHSFNSQALQSTHVSTIISLGAVLYFFTNNALTNRASRAFNAEMLSANLQLIGTLGESDPWKTILPRRSSVSAGRPSLIRGFFMIPFKNTFSASRGTEYISDVCVVLQMVKTTKRKTVQNEIIE